MKILLGDDHRLFSTGIVTLFGNVIPDFGATCVYSGVDMPQKIKTESFDPALFDSHIPDRDGVNILKTLQDSASLIPVDILAESDNLLDAEKTFDASKAELLRLG